MSTSTDTTDDRHERGMEPYLLLDHAHRNGPCLVRRATPGSRIAVAFPDGRGDVTYFELRIDPYTVALNVKAPGGEWSTEWRQRRPDGAGED